MYMKKEDSSYFKETFYFLNKARLKEFLGSQLKTRNPKHKQGGDR